MDIDYSVYLVTDQFDFTESEFLNIIEEALKGNTTIVQIREKNSSTRDFLNLAQKVKKLTDKYNDQEIYKLDVIEIPTNKPMIRKDHNDVIYKNEAGKFRAVVKEVKESHAKGQPVLIGTVSIEKSEKLSKMLQKEGIKHEVLNAKQHEKEAEIIAQAGKYGAVTIATNMAGRGTDIVLGGIPLF